MDNTEKLELIKRSIESLNKFHQVEVLRILSRNLCKINENKSGVYVNLSFLDSSTIDELETYLEYTKDQEDVLTTTEYQKQEFRNNFFQEKEDKDNITISYSSSKQWLHIHSNCSFYLDDKRITQIRFSSEWVIAH